MNKVLIFCTYAAAAACFLITCLPVTAYGNENYPNSPSSVGRTQTYMRIQPRNTNTLPLNETRANDLLASKEIVLMIDSSDSMSTCDCPVGGFFGGAVSRWDWCREQTLNLGRTTPSVLSGGMDIITFRTSFKDWGQATLRDVEEIYRRNHPAGGTRLGEALAYVFDRYFSQQASGYQRKKPLLVVVITDGCPHDKNLVRDVLIETSQKAAYPRQAEVVFLQISDNFEGSHFLDKLTNELVDKGARYPIVDTEPFEVVRRLGIKEALVEAVLHSEHS